MYMYKASFCKLCGLAYVHVHDYIVIAHACNNTSQIQMLFWSYIYTVCLFVCPWNLLTYRSSALIRIGVYTTMGTGLVSHSKGRLLQPNKPT